MGKSSKKGSKNEMESPLVKEVKRMDYVHWCDLLEVAMKLGFINRNTPENELKPENFKNLAVKLAERSIQ